MGKSRTEYKRSWRNANRERVRKYWRDHRATHSEQYRNRKLQERYGITLDVLAVLLSLQEGRCGICAEPLVKPCVDHDHKRKYTRGLLCHRCNMGLGYFVDNPLYLMRAAVYLRERTIG